MDMKREQSRAWMLMAALVLLAALIGGKEFWRAFRYESRQVLQEYTEKMYMPGVAYQRADETRSSKDWFREKALSWLPLVKYVSDRENLEQEVEDEETLEVTQETVDMADLAEAQAVLDSYGEEPDPADYGIWVPGIPVLWAICWIPSDVLTGCPA